MGKEFARFAGFRGIGGMVATWGFRGFSDFWGLWGLWELWELQKLWELAGTVEMWDGMVGRNSWANGGNLEVQVDRVSHDRFTGLGLYSSILCNC